MTEFTLPYSAPYYTEIISRSSHRTSVVYNESIAILLRYTNSNNDKTFVSISLCRINVIILSDMRIIRSIGN